MEKIREGNHLELLLELLRHGLAEANEPATVGRQALNLILDSLSILRGEIFYLDQLGQLKLLTLAGYGKSDISNSEAKVEQRLQQALIGRVLESGKGVIIPDVNCQEYWLPIPDLDEDICSVAALPLKTDQEVLGVISLLSDQMDFFTEEQLPLLTAVAATLALVLKNARLFYQVKTGQNQLRKLTKKLVETQEAERKRVSRALHDETGQTLALLKMRLKKINDEFPAESPVREELQEINQHLSSMMARIYRLAYNLRPPEIDTLGLNAALKTLCKEFTQHADFPVTYQGTTTLPDLPDNVRIAFYRCLQESLSNIAKHAQATLVQVRLTSDGEGVSLQVKDNGRGLPTGVISAGSGLGLLGMRERFESIDGFLIIESTKDEGTTLTASVPWQKSKEEGADEGNDNNTNGN